jgi:hypothetical protein
MGADDWGYENEYDDRDGDDIEFADPGGNSALRAATTGKCPGCKKRTGINAAYCPHCGRQLNPRNLPCPNCRKPNRLTPADRARGYQCDECADRLERGCD